MKMEVGENYSMQPNDLERFNLVTESIEKFNHITANSLSIMDKRGKVINEFNYDYFTDFCHAVTSSENTSGFCYCSDTHAFIEKIKYGEPHLEVCPMGLNHILVPIRSLNNELTLSHGQFLTKETEGSFWENLESNCKQYGFDYNEMKRKAQSIPILNKAELDARLKMLKTFANYVSININEIQSKKEYYNISRQKAECETKLKEISLGNKEMKIAQSVITESLKTTIDVALSEHAGKTASMLYTLLYFLYKSNTMEKASIEERYAFLEELDRYEESLTNRPSDEEKKKDTVLVKTDRKDRLVDMACAIIKNRYQKRISLESVAKELFITPVYLCKIFKEKTGSNFKDYLINVRLEEARKLILRGGKSINEIALEVGYSEPGYFGKSFKAKYGCSPGKV